ncbi:uncharacterized protein LOC121505071 isoform X2 [Cheilinus undulatus]|uniref:uncharacterized protein LOC121505071 isoform X2 n=1 Tax=Cheilinus undulatus TaxID=241271 RepID=UPI001BD46159|nr:uncharacterized protein LOC121505071 isoform X2 [Cheilinus undulatus]
MIYWILLLFSLTSCVSASPGTNKVTLTQPSHEAESEENQNVTLEWTFTAVDNFLVDTLQILCDMTSDLKASVLFDFTEGVGITPKDGEFAGRVHWDKDAIRDGRIRLRLSSLRMNDSGRYGCVVWAGQTSNKSSYKLRVTAARARREPVTEPVAKPVTLSEKPNVERWGWKGILALLAMTSGFIALVVAFTLNSLYILRFFKGKFKQIITYQKTEMRTLFSEGHRPEISV